MSTEADLVSVTIVTYNSESSLQRCLDSVLAQDWPKVEVIVVDNASGDRTREILRGYQNRLLLILNAENRGFAAAQNQAIRQSRGNWVLVLNPDAMLAPNFVSQLVHASQPDHSVGTLCGKLLRALPGLEIPPEREVDSAGMYMTPTFRHFDRGLGEPDTGAYDTPAYVFGATGAAALYRRAMIEDVSVGGEFFDEDFFFSREDADVAWRAQLLGWKCLYVPTAVGYHVRRVHPKVRRRLPAPINAHGVKNRFLMRIKNAGWALYLRKGLMVTTRDIGILTYCLLRERSSMPSLWYAWRHWGRIMAKRRVIQEKRRVRDAELARWFRFHPVTMPADPLPTSASRSPLVQGSSRPLFSVSNDGA